MEKRKKKTIITFKAINWEGKIVHKNIPIYHDFEEIPSCKFRGIDLPPTTIEEQVIEFLDNQDKSQLMNVYEFDVILDYYPKKPRKKKGDELNEFMEFCQPYLDMNPILKRPFEAIISESKDVLFGKHKSNEQKFNEVLNTYGMLLKAANGAFDIALKIMNGDNRKEELIINQVEVK
jgi:hypothetical protein